MGDVYLLGTFICKPTASHGTVEIESHIRHPADGGKMSLHIYDMGPSGVGRQGASNISFSPWMKV